MFKSQFQQQVCPADHDIDIHFHLTGAGNRLACHNTAVADIDIRFQVVKLKKGRSSKQWGRISDFHPGDTSPAKPVMRPLLVNPTAPKESDIEN